jgi:hypothetical protein
MSFSVMGEMAEVQHAASLFLGLDQRSEQASCSSGVRGIFPILPGVWGIFPMFYYAN